MLVKKWAKKHDINDASCGTLSSYALTLMVLHYLQGEVVIKCCPIFNPLSPDSAIWHKMQLHVLTCRNIICK